MAPRNNSIDKTRAAVYEANIINSPIPNSPINQSEQPWPWPLSNQANSRICRSLYSTALGWKKCLIEWRLLYGDSNEAFDGRGSAITGGA